MTKQSFATKIFPNDNYPLINVRDYIDYILFIVVCRIFCTYLTTIDF
ncbi:hypothetical protein Metig_1116 [Methanotorris igneus Kol 5]|uniref:Uncharacterized protein n=1 Tax=Methanotorris igneus (strain DSM 5666 / JCM 11834 / Kol 5) TaxID=880724 RepID=F6BDU4_METIK|nr:hypothetical protein Metig_1116 [Methanotorris igneus Kol 5]